MLEGPTGLHARAAAAVAHEARAFEASVTLTNLDRAPQHAASARSILALLGLAARPGDRIALRADGPDAAAAVAAIRRALGPRQDRSA